MNSTNAAATIGLLYLVLFAAGLIGWVMNIVTLFGMTLTPLTGEGIIRIAGIFIAPVGAFMGWF